MLQTLSRRFIKSVASSGNESCGDLCKRFQTKVFDVKIVERGCRSSCPSIHLFLGSQKSFQLCLWNNFIYLLIKNDFQRDDLVTSFGSCESAQTTLPVIYHIVLLWLLYTTILHRAMCKPDLHVENNVFENKAYWKTKAELQVLPITSIETEWSNLKIILEFFLFFN